LKRFSSHFAETSLGFRVLM